MKIKLAIIFFVATVCACSQEVPRISEKVVNCEPSAQVADPNKIQESKVDNYKVIDWGPRSTIVGVNPNIQPGDGMGLWIRVSGFTASDKIKVIFDGKPALITTLDGDLITASVAADLIKNSGAKEVLITSENRKDNIFVGQFNVEMTDK